MTALHPFVNEYRAAFTRGDRDALAKFFLFPLHIVSANDNAITISVADHSEWLDVLDGLLGAYASLGVVEVEPVVLDLRSMTARLRSALVRWELRAIVKSCG